MRFVATAALALTLAACGGGGGGSTSVPVQAVQVTPVAVAMYGDSTQEGRPPNWGAPPYTPPADAAQAELRRLTGRQDIAVTSYGIGLTDSKQLLDGTDGSGLDWSHRIAASGARFVTINHGINDNARPVDEYRFVLGELVRQAQAQGKVPVLETPSPIVDGGVIAAYFSIPAHDAKVQTMRDVARDTGAVLCDEYASIKADHRDTLADLPDGVHGTPDFYAYKGRLLAACLAPLLH